MEVECNGKLTAKSEQKPCKTERFETEMLLFKLAKIMHVREQVAKPLAGLGSLVFFTCPPHANKSGAIDILFT